MVPPMIVLRARRRWPSALEHCRRGRVEAEACPPRRSGADVAAPSRFAAVRRHLPRGNKAAPADSRPIG